MTERKRLALIITAAALAGIITGLFLGRRLNLLAFMAAIIAAWLFFLASFQGYIAFGSKWKAAAARIPVVVSLGLVTGLFFAGRLLPAPEAPTAAAVKPPENQVWMINHDWAPKTLTVTVGTNITWYNKEPEHHTVVSSDGLFDAPITDAFPFSYTFTKPGTYSFYCKIHPEYEPHNEAVGVVIVTE